MPSILSVGPFVVASWPRNRLALAGLSVGGRGRGGVAVAALRHAIASLWLHEGHSAVEVAAWLGNSPSVTFDTYARVIAELADKPRISAEEAIREAREVPHGFPCEEAAAGA